jgi:hypothetical protein
MMGFERSSVLMVLFIETSPRGGELEGRDRETKGM